MVAFSTSSMVMITFLSARTMGYAIPKNDSPREGHYGLGDFTLKYIQEVTAQQEAIEAIESQLKLAEKPSREEIANQANALVEAHYGRLPREVLVDLLPSDSVLNAESFEYLASVSSRYSENVLHAARQIRNAPLRKGCSLGALRYLKAEHEKAQMFDRLLLGLTTLAANEADWMKEKENVVVSDENTEDPSEQALLPEESASVDNQASDENYEDADGRDVDFPQTISVEEEIQTTTETITTSYTETTVTWSN